MARHIKITPTLQQVTDVGSSTDNAVGIGVTTPVAKLHVVDTNEETIRFVNTSNTSRVGVHLYNDLGSSLGGLAGYGSGSGGSWGASRVSRVGLFANAAANGIDITAEDDIRFSSGGFADACLRMVISTDGNVGIGGTTFDGTARKTFQITGSTEPGGSVQDTVQFYEKDSSQGAGHGTLGLYLEEAVEAIGTFTATHKLRVWINGTEYWIQLDAV
jgi:hypothetical protein